MATSAYMGPLLASFIVLMVTNVFLLSKLDRRQSDRVIDLPHWIIVGDGFVELELIYDEEPQTKSSEKETWKHILSMPSTGYHSFNATASDLVSIDRIPWDTRPVACKDLYYDENALPSTSIIIVFHNEARSTLLRTIHSFVNRTAPRLLEEVILVDDASTHPWLLQPLTVYVARLPKVHLIRLSRRQGLIRARLKGAEAANGQVLMFVDAHTEANVNWLPPLLHRLLENRKSVVIPTMDIIDWQTFNYLRPVRRSHGSMTWDLVFEYKSLPTRLDGLADTDPIPSPIMVGCAHAVWREHFLSTGSYDTGMEIWGGENIEHSLRTWMCGGTVEIIPCSRVGHVFKPRLPYAFNDNSEKTVTRNLVRTAEVWMDDSKGIYFALLPSLPTVDVVSLQERHALRQRLGCRDFQWYLDNILPELEKPPRTAIYYGRLRHSGKCLQPKGHKGKLLDCDESQKPFMLDNDGHLTWSGQDLPVSNARQTWQFRPVGDQGQLHTSSNTCLTLSGDTLTLLPCQDNTDQLWTFQYHFNWTNADADVNLVYNNSMSRPPEAVHFGQLSHVGSKRCLEVYDNTEYDLVNCNQQQRYRRVFHLDKDAKLRYDGFCFQASSIEDLQILPCDRLKHNIWSYDIKSKNLLNSKISKCLSFNPAVSTKVLYVSCSNVDAFQKWEFKSK